MSWGLHTVADDSKRGEIERARERDAVTGTEEQNVTGVIEYVPTYVSKSKHIHTIHILCNPWGQIRV
jgi:hypothetical protein